MKLLFYFIVFKSKNWENAFYMLLFMGFAIFFYKMMKWNVAIRRNKKMDEISTKGSIIKNWIMVITCLFCAFIQLLRLIF